MNIKKSSEMKLYQIDLNSPEGYSFHLLEMACHYANLFGLNREEITRDMTAGDSKHLVSAL